MVTDTARPPARPPHIHRQDRLQYTAPQLASAQCKNVAGAPNTVGNVTCKQSVSSSTIMSSGLTDCTEFLSHNYTSLGNEHCVYVWMISHYILVFVTLIFVTA